MKQAGPLKAPTPQTGGNITGPDKRGLRGNDYRLILFGPTHSS